MIVENVIFMSFVVFYVVTSFSAIIFLIIKLKELERINKILQEILRIKGEENDRNSD